MPSSKPRPTCSVELRFIRIDEDNVQLTVSIDDKTIRIEAYNRNRLFLECEPAVRDAVRKAIQQV